MRTVLFLLLIVSLLLAACQAAPAAQATQPVPAAQVTPPVPAAQVTLPVPVTAQSTATALALPTEAVPTAMPPTAAATLVQPTATAASGENDTGYESASSPTAAGTQGAALEAVIEAMRNLARLQSFGADQTVTTVDETLTSELEILPPDRIRMINPEFEMVIIGGDAYIKIGEDWMKFPSAGQELVGNYVFMASEEDEQEYRAALSNVRQLAGEELNGERMHVYQYTIPDTESDAVADATLWVSEADGLPRRLAMIITGADPDDNGEILVIYRDFNTPFVIEPPF